MNRLKNALASFFIAEVVYVLVVILLITLMRQQAVGLRVVLAIAASPLPIGFSIVSLIVSFMLFSRRR